MPKLLPMQIATTHGWTNLTGNDRCRYPISNELVEKLTDLRGLAVVFSYRPIDSIRF